MGLRSHWETGPRLASQARLARFLCVLAPVLLAAQTLDEKIDAAACDVILRASRSVVLMLDDKAAARLGPLLRVQTLRVSLSAQVVYEPRPEPRPAASERTGMTSLEGRLPKPEHVAALIYTSGTTDAPKGVMLSHYNLTSLVASLGPLFPLERDDRLLSVLPLHHTFELTCGLLLPLSRGARVVYLDQVTRERLSETLREANITAMVGVPALWESLERQIHSRIEERGPIAGKAFEFALMLSRTLGDRLGMDVGRLLFGPVHASLGGQLRLLVSGGAALPARGWTSPEAERRPPGCGGRPWRRSRPRSAECARWPGTWHPR